jgi:transposase-like protein
MVGKATRGEVMAVKKQAKEKDAIDELLDQIDYKHFVGKTQEEILGQDGLIKQLTGRLLQKVLEAEMTAHLGYTKHDNAGDNTGNSRNGYTTKTVYTENQEAEIQVPRDRAGTFNPVVIPKHSKRVPLFNEQIISMYASGMSDRQIKEHLDRVYGVDVSRDLVSRVTDSVIEDVREWQSRPLDKTYMIVYLDAIRIKCRQDGKSINKSVNVAMGVTIEGKKEVLGMWITENEGAKFWLGVMNELKNRGVQDILIACMDGLTGFPEAVRAVFPQTHIQLCIVHMVRNSVKYVSYKDRKEMCNDLKEIYQAASEDAGLAGLERFGEKWNSKYPMIYESWNSKWHDLCEFFKYGPEIRRAIYTTNAIESLNFQFRKITNSRLTFPTDESILKVLYLAIQNASVKWTMPIRNWGAALNEFAIEFGKERVPLFS